LFHPGAQELPLASMMKNLYFSLQRSAVLYTSILSPFEAENVIVGNAQTTIIVMIDSLLKFPYYSIIPSSSGHLSLLIFLSAKILYTYTP
jgi:hypothetical protein